MFRCMVASSAAALMTLGLLAGDQIANAEAAIQRRVLVQQDLNFPNLQMLTQLVEIPVGGREVRHTHPGVLSIYVLDGTITIEHEGRPVTTYRAGDSLHIDAGKIHFGMNTGNIPVKLLATLVSEKGKPLSTPAP